MQSRKPKKKTQWEGITLYMCETVSLGINLKHVHSIDYEHTLLIWPFIPHQRKVWDAKLLNFILDEG